MQVYFLIIMFILGACLGSFLCCQARRLRLKQTKNQKLGPRSVCLKCDYKLKWYDNIPILSWILLRGKCRKCHKKIGYAEIISELGFGFSFLAISSTIDLLTNMSPLDIVTSVIMLLLIISLGFLAIYDGIYGELPSFAIIISIVLSMITVVLNEYNFFLSADFSFGLLLSRLLSVPLSVAIIGGLYLVLYLISKGKWVGDGDWLLGVVIGLALGNPWLSLITLFIANILACLIMFPFIKKQSSKKIYFGPFFVVAFIITYTFANFFQSMIQ